ncbi:hypothetical protein KBZ12_11080 [Cyanobium sp. Cruz CV13-4-11]|jgi:hypothetical protein|uniref:hypothetical protein n=1 Tax=unclassified Cyanobium TaxID=2627006 RepID=UPI0020CEE804|nr:MULTISPECIES: hypothetical protein [unclassified Cyanobium]MCP9901919.1 hypothetical protein [Cyanobium sp. Cruz CV11-17]MCP9920011.1 hypothetical protein [Cyanobium sp. Cruz CV13-4-11]
MQPPPSIEQLRAERPDLTDEQMLEREGRIRLVQQARMTGFPGEVSVPPDNPDDPWPQEPELQEWCNLKGSPLTLSTNTGCPADPDEPNNLEAWCAYHGIELHTGTVAGAP